METIRVLIVDDEIDTLTLIALTLRRRGFSVDTAENALAGLKMIKEGVYEVVLIDLRMNGMDGLTMLETLQKSDYARHLRPIIHTAAPMKDDFRRQLIGAGAWEIIQKPVMPDALAAIIHKVCDKAAV